ncbi:hypothetical protein [uncultured Erythrobacter sp.]|uniref:hypothetical protein n=1 Tax=uncultured Erythrobacter sp. TaxID=263913 RepID=UPI0026347F35|nr:hypothetical protein [uncultured Erythrobacter sp.]
MLVERRRAAFPLEFLTRVGIAWAIVSALLLAINWSAIIAGRFPDPDDIMRLVQVRDLIGGQSWFDLTQYRVDVASGGVPMHWSRLVDLPLALVILVLTPLVGSGAAETAALVIVPLVTLGIAMLLAARIAWRLMGDEEATLTTLVVALCVPVLFQLGPMRIDHHGWQIVCALAAVNGLVSRSPRKGGLIIGAALATWLSISIEGLPLAALFFAVLALRWFLKREARVWLVSAIQSFAVLGAGLFVLTRGVSDFATYCDAISPLHLLMFAWGAGVLSVLSRFEPAPRGVILAGFAVAGGGALAMLLASAPQCASGGGFSELDPLVARYWHANVLEGMPIWRQSLTTALQYAVTPAIALVASINLALRSGDWLRAFWRDYAIVLGGALLISILISRAGAVAGVLAAPPLAWQLRQWLRSIRVMKRPAPRLAALIGVCCALLPAFPAMLLASAMPARASLGGAGEAPVKAVECRIRDAAGVLAALPKGEFYAPLDIAPELLLVSDHTVLATGHHRGHEAMRVLIETALADEAEAKAALTERGTSYVAICPSLAEARMYARIAPEGFAADLVSGNAPDWLEPVDQAQSNGLKLWRIKSE